MAGVQFPTAAREFSFLHSTQTRSETQPTYQMSIWHIAELGVKLTTLSSAEAKNNGAVPPLPLLIHDVLNFAKK
jgi:hypothetical protein